MMEKEKVALTAADFNAIEWHDSNYLNSKGAKQYIKEDYKTAVEYYHLAAAMGNPQAISNLGYCYLYGRDIEPNLSLAIAYFKIAARHDVVDAAYKLGDIYSRDKWGVRDRELSNYYYRMAASLIIDEEWEGNQVITKSYELEKYPSLCYALGREMAIGGAMNTDLDSAYQFLRKAETGYRRELMNGAVMYEQSYEGVQALLADAQFDEIRGKYEDEDEE